MNNKQFAILVAVIALCLGGPPTAQALGVAFAEVKNCDNITIGAVDVVDSKTCMGGTGSSITVQNQLTDCIRVGGSGVTATTGLEVGVDCDAGPVVTFDAKRLYMISESGDVAGVDVVWGQN